MLRPKPGMSLLALNNPLAEIVGGGKLKAGCLVRGWMAFVPPDDRGRTTSPAYQGLTWPKDNEISARCPASELSTDNARPKSEGCAGAHGGALPFAVGRDQRNHGGVYFDHLGGCFSSSLVFLHLLFGR